MLRQSYYRALNAIPLAAFWRQAKQFTSALSNPEAVQREILFDLLKQNRDCAFGARHGFESIRTVREFQDRVPVASYDDLAPWVERIKAGEQNVLTSEPVLAFEKSSGSASAAKYIPYTRTLQTQFQAALAPWLTDMHKSYPDVSRGSAYWVVTPLSRQKERTEGGIRIGFESDTEYFAPLQRSILRRTLAIPEALARVPDLDDCLYLTLRFLLQGRSLAFISVWSPSFLLILLERLQEYGERLVQDLTAGKVDIAASLPSRLTRWPVRDIRQAGNLRAMLRRGRIEPSVLWPRLSLISCWMSAASASIKCEVEEKFPGVPIQGKGLLATEGVVSIPIESQGAPVAAVTSHFFEFVDHSSGECRLLTELEQGREYSVVLTTGGGLWRYRLGDRVRVAGFAQRTALLEFIGKEDCVSDLRGEKLNSLFVSHSLAGFESCRSASFSMLAPAEAKPPHYILFIESRRCTPDLAARLDRKLQENPHYEYCRRVGQLGPLQVFMIDRNAHNSYVNRCIGLGHRAGNVKVTSLHRATGWEHVFQGTYMETRTAEFCA